MSVIQIKNLTETKAKAAEAAAENIDMHTLRMRDLHVRCDSRYDSALTLPRHNFINAHIHYSHHTGHTIHTCPAHIQGCFHSSQLSFELILPCKSILFSRSPSFCALY